MATIVVSEPYFEAFSFTRYLRSYGYVNEYKERISLERSGEETSGRESYVMKDKSQNVFIRLVEKACIVVSISPRSNDYGSGAWKSGRWQEMAEGVSYMGNETCEDKRPLFQDLLSV